MSRGIEGIKIFMNRDDMKKAGEIFTGLFLITA
jgi:hypothetical protein